MVSGTWDGPLVDVDFPNDAGFLRVGPSYLVAAQVDAATGKLYSKVRSTFRTRARSEQLRRVTTRSSPGSPTGRPSTPASSRG